MVKKHKRKSSKKSKRKSLRVKKSVCSLRNKKQCGGDPNCHYVKRRGCTRRKGVYEGPILPAYMMI